MRTPVIGTADFKVQKLDKLYQEQRLLFNTEYQRSFIWKRPKKQLLIDSMLRDYDINKIFLRQRSNGAYECLDGQQRLRSIFEYIGSDGPDKEFPLKENSPVGKRKFSELAPEFKYKILYYSIDAVVVYKADEEALTDLFLRLQEGMPLNSAEKLNAMRGLLRNKVVELSKNKFFQKVGISEYRFTHRFLCAQIALLEHANSSLPPQGYRIVETKFSALKRLYKTFSDEEPENVFVRATRVLNFLDKTLDSSSAILRRKSDFVPIYLLASYLLRKYVMTEKKKEFREFVEKFIQKVASITDMNVQFSEESNPYIEYKIARSRAVSTKLSIEGGFIIMLRRFLQLNPDIELKDPQRAFDYGQKLAIYLRDGKKCIDCEHNLNFNQAEYHHIEFWEHGGPTTVENGALLCHNCHVKRHSARLMAMRQGE